jgi:hypothetical protein
MELLYGKRLSKDLDAIRHESRIKRELLKLIKKASTPEICARGLFVRRWHKQYADHRLD